MKKSAYLFFCFSLVSQLAFSQGDKTIDLYQKVPGSKAAAGYVEIMDSTHAKKVINPQLYAFFPKQPNGTAVVICPGGGYSGLAIKKEGFDVAKQFIARGVTAFVLKYRLPSDEIMEDRKIGPLQDAQQAIKYVRDHAKEYQLDTSKVGIMGFSAGGHLASTAATHFGQVVISNKEKTSVRPSFAILIYPVVTMGAETHQGSKNNLIGKDASAELVKLYSNEMQVSPNTPMTYLVHANDDKAVPVNNSLHFIQALNKNGVKNGAFIYQNGGHGFGLNNKTSKDPWFDRLMFWMEENGL